MCMRLKLFEFEEWSLHLHVLVLQSIAQIKCMHPIGSGDRGAMLIPPLFGQYLAPNIKV